MDLALDLGTILDNLTQLKKNVTVIQHQVKQVEKSVVRRQVNELKLKDKKKQKQINKKAYGFAKPSKISDELCEFMGKDKGTTMARTEVTKYLHEYIKKNDLQLMTNKTIIIPDINLKNLLDIEEQIHFFSLQKHMNKHFVT